MNIFLRKTENRSKPNRRDFMIQSTCASLGITSLVNTITQLQLVGAASAQTAGDYKALVCLFLNGGNDSNNLLIPSGSSTARTAYEAGRGTLAIPDASFDFTPSGTNGYFGVTGSATSRLAPDNLGEYDPADIAGYTGSQMAVHPGAYPLKDLFDQGDLAFITNVGTLVGTQQVTRANFNTLPAAAKPPQLFSHSDQQVQWQSSLPDEPFSRGWGGRIADLLAGMNDGDLSLSVSLAGVNSFQVAFNEPAYFMNSSGSVSSLTGFGSPYTTALRNTGLQPVYTNPASTPGGKYNPLANLAPGADPLIGTNYQHNAAGWRLRAIEQILAMSHANLFDEAYTATPKNARVTEGLVGNALAQTAAGGPIGPLDIHFDNWYPNGLFNPRITDFANQLKVVARMIAGRDQLNNRRQIFFVQLGGWDTHTSQIPGATNQGHYGLVNNLSRAVRAFKDAMVQIGMWDNVLLFSASDFNRTFTPNKNDATGGSDHAWGGHMFVTGGGVKGKNIYGKYPNLQINGGIDCTGNRGRWIPSTSVDQVAAQIAKWFGVADGDMNTIFPNLTRFMPDLDASTLQSRNLDFVNFS